MKKKYYILGVGYESSDSRKTYPYEIWLDLQETRRPIMVLEGRGFAGVGGSFSPKELLDNKWLKNLNITKTEWLLPFFKDAENNDGVLDSESLINFYKYKHGELPVLKEI